MALDFWFDPGCPWTWITSRWAVDVAEQRGMDIRWRLFSLGIKNGLLGDEAPEGVPEPIVRGVRFSHRALRVLEAVRQQDEAGVGPLYAELGRRIHHDEQVDFDLAEALTATGLDPSLAAAADDESYDAAVESSMQEGLALVGDDVGVPILGFEADDGGAVGFFGPIVSPAPTGKDALRLYDAVEAAATLPGFYELKRTRDVGPIMPAASA